MAVHRFFLKKLEAEGLTIGDVARASNCTISQVIDLMSRRKPLGEDRIERIARTMRIREHEIDKMKYMNRKIKEKQEKIKASFSSYSMFAFEE